MALDPRVLTTLATLKGELGITDTTKDSRLERLITVATDLAESECERVFSYGAAISESVRSYGTPVVVVERRPILSIASVTELGTLLDGTADYAIDPAVFGADAGRILRYGTTTYNLRGWPWSAVRAPGISQDKLSGTEAPAIIVVYAGGWVTPEQATSAGWSGPARSLPYDLEQAVLELAVSLYRGAGEDRNVSAERVGGGSQDWAKGRGAIPDGVLAMLRPYKRIAGAAV